MNKYSLNCKVRKEGDTQENISLFADTYNLKFLSKDDLNFAYNQFYNERDKKVIKYIKEFKENFSKKQYQKFLDFKKTHNVKDNSSLEFFISKYGKEKGLLYFEEKTKKTVGTLENFVKKYGEEIGKQKYLSKCKTHSFRGTLNGYIDLYGVTEGTKRYNHFCERNRGNFSLERMIELYGKEHGKIRYNECQKKLKSKNTLEYHRQKYGNVEGERRYNERNKKNSESTKKMTNAIWQIGTEPYYRWLKTMKDKGRITGIPIELQPKIRRYYNLVWKETLKQPLFLLKNFEKRNHQNVLGSFAIDHKISILFGFKHNIPYYIIGNIDNLQMLPHSLNSSKGSNCYSVIEYCEHKILGDKFNDFRF